MQNVKVNPDAEYVARIRKAIKDKDGYCPCVLIKSPHTKCMCREFRDQVERGEPGFCHCGLYYIEAEK